MTKANVATVQVASESPAAPAMGHNGGPSLASASVTSHEDPKTPFHVQVVTSVPDKAVIVDSRICDIRDFQSRKWLANHQFWAMHQGHTVELHPATSDEVLSYTQRQAALLSNRYRK